MAAFSGVYRAQIVSTSDPTAAGRVQVMIPAIAGANSVWAPVCGPFGTATGSPRIGATVWIAFENGDATRPVVMGTSR